MLGSEARGRRGYDARPRHFTYSKRVCLFSYTINTHIQSGAAQTTKRKMADSILARKRDLVYLIFFLTHLPVMLSK